MEKNTEMKCNNCGLDNPDQARFCGSCGLKFVPDEEESLPTILEPTILVSEDIAQQPPAPRLPAAPTPKLPAAPTPFIWPLSGPKHESIENYPTEVGQMPLAPPPGWPVFQEKKEGTQKPTARKIFQTWLLMQWPRPIFYGAIAALALVLLLLSLTGGDWATGIAHAAIAAAIVVLLLICALGLRLTMGKVARSSAQRRTQYISAGLVILILLLFIGTAFSFQPALHSVQARSLEQKQQWEQAITQYQLSGDSAPTSTNIARTYNEWGKNLTQKQLYAQAISKFETVLNQYNKTGSQVTHARQNEINAYIAAGKLEQKKQNYSNAVIDFDTLLQLKYCVAQCQAEGLPLDANAYYDLAKSQLAAMHYADAVDSFTILQQRFSTTSAYHASHGNMAKALFGLGQQQIKANQCSAAVSNYQQLTKNFANTPQGKKAAVALKAPQSVKGHFTKPVPAGHAQAVLTQGVSAKNWKNQFSQALAKHPPIATIQANGTFVFKSVKPGTYALSWGTIAANGNQKFSTAFLPSNPGAYYYVAHVGQLCSVDFGNITLDIPKAS